jgi:hypothetical protein
MFDQKLVDMLHIGGRGEFAEPVVDDVDALATSLCGWATVTRKREQICFSRTLGGKSKLIHGAEHLE